MRVEFQFYRLLSLLIMHGVVSPASLIVLPTCSVRYSVKPLDDLFFFFFFISRGGTSEAVSIVVVFKQAFDVHLSCPSRGQTGSQQNLNTARFLLTEIKMNLLVSHF